MTSSDENPSKVPDRSEQEFKDVGELIRSGKLVTIHVGPAKEPWIIHEDLICNKSTFFRNAFQGGFAEGASKSLMLEEDDPAVFKLFVEWLYGARPRDCRKDHGQDAWKYFMVLYGLDIFADKIGSTKLREYVLETYWNCMEYVWVNFLHRPVEEIEMVFEKCPAGSPFRQDVVDDVLHEYLRKDFSDYKYWADVMSCSKTFSEEFARALRKHVEEDYCSWIDVCIIHANELNATATS
ncbi:hypothetical protein BKA64DRAFT_719304 [Cadophora sp. MPI-SDFR-AT-0126]|nr:hypothetical protein BKA64DRAFT_719304 [Leotiomycetes sp. MPI-SDFR-AT-0126]